MQIHELNTYGGGLNNNAFLAVDNGNDTGKVSFNNLMGPVNERIDNIIGGDAPSAAEVTDARLGENGLTYSTLGDAIRGQAGDLNNGIIESNQGRANFGLYTPFRRGTYASGVYQGVTYRVCSTNLFTTEHMTKLHIKPGFKVFYDIYVNGNYSSSTGWRTSSDDAAIPKGRSIKVTIARETENTSEAITPSGMAEFIEAITFDTIEYDQMIKPLIAQDIAVPLTITANPGYIGSGGSVVSPDSTQQIYTDRYATVPGGSFYYRTCGISDRTWMAVAWYDVNGNFVTRQELVNAITKFEEQVVTVPSDVYYAVFMITTYGNSDILELWKFSSNQLIEKAFRDSQDGKWFGVDLNTYTGAWIRYSNGEKVASAATRLYEYDVENISAIRCFLKSDTNVICAVAFYSGDSISTDTYMQAESVPWYSSAPNGAWYEVTVPAGAKHAAISTGNPTGSFEPQVLFPVSDVAFALDAAYFDPMFDAIERSEDNAYGYAFPFAFDKFYHHMFMGNVTDSFSSEITIPAQSIFDVQVAARLGFKYIEANVHKTATAGKYVVTHGVDGKLGNDFETIEGGTASTVVIATTAYDTLRDNFRYRSIYPKYKVPITSLEEFLEECRTCNIYPVLQYVDETELEIAKGIVGNNMILYNGNRSVFGGYIVEYLSLGTKEAILSHCKSIGKPYMYCMANHTSFTDAQLREIVDLLHQNGYYIGNAGNYYGMTENIRLMNLGFDFSASGGMVNDFNDGNILNIVSDPEFTGITTDGTVTNGTLKLTNGQYVEFSTDDTSMLKKYILDIDFKGTIQFTRPSFTKRTGDTADNYTSDGSQSMRISGTAIKRTARFVIEASGNVDIYELGFKLSKC